MNPIRTPLSWSMRLALLQIYRSVAGWHQPHHLSTLWALQRRGLATVSGRRVWLTLEGRRQGKCEAIKDDLRQDYIRGLLDAESPEGHGADDPIGV